MSLYLKFDTGAQRELASNLGYSQFGDWVTDLDAGKYYQVHHLFEFGWCQQLETLLSQLQAALKASPPSRDVTTTVKLLIENLSDRGTAEAVVVSDGTGPETTVEQAQEKLNELKRRRRQ